MPSTHDNASQSVRRIYSTPATMGDVPQIRTLMHRKEDHYFSQFPPPKRTIATHFQRMAKSSESLSNTAIQCLCHCTWQGVSLGGERHHAGLVIHRSSQYAIHSMISIQQTVTASDTGIGGCIRLIHRRYPSKETDRAIFAAAH